MDKKQLRGRLEQRRKQLKDEQYTWLGHWREISDYILPHHGRYLAGDEGDEKDNDGRKRHDKILNCTATDGMDILASGMQSGITSPARPWFRLQTPDPELQGYAPVKEWLFQVEKMMRFIFSRSNVYQALHQTYMELGAFCTGCMSVMEDFNRLIRCRAYTAGEYMLGVDGRGIVDTMYRKFEITAIALVGLFGEDNVSDAAKRAYDNGNVEEPFSVIHVIEPNDDRLKPIAATRGKEYRSIYYEEKAGDEKILSIKGFNQFPVMAPRWNVVGRNAYGTGPGMKILGDVKMLQAMEKKGLIALDKAIEPPLRAPTSLEGSVINTFPGGISYVDEMQQGQGLSPLYEVKPDMQGNEYKIEKVEARIRRGLYNDLFLMLQQQDVKRKQMTATEVAERHEEKLLMLGPVLERLHAELLDPLIDRTFNIMTENDILPPAPPELEGVDLRVEYISILAQAQKMVSLNSIEQFTGYAGNLAGLFPEIRHDFDPRAALEEYQDGVGAPPKLLRSKDEAEASRQAEAQEMQRQQAMEQAKDSADAAKTLADTPVGGNTALDELLGRPQQ